MNVTTASRDLRFLPLRPALTAPPRKRRGRAPSPGLSAREEEVVALVHAGLTDKEIARDLGLSRLTVKGHLQKIFRKLGLLHSRVLVALWWERERIRKAQA